MNVGVLDLIPGVGLLKTIAIAAAITSLVSTGVGLERYYAGKRAGIAKQQAVIDKLKLDMQTVAAAAKLKYEAFQAAMIDKLTEAYRAGNTEKQKSKRFELDLARARTERNGLRDQLRDAAAGGRGPTEDSIAACRGRADALAVLLDEGVRVQEEIATGAETCSTDLRTVLRAWPVNP